MPSLGSLFLLTAATCGVPSPRAGVKADTAEFVRLEQVWNDAHVHADTAALNRLWDDDLITTVPEMPVMGKADIMRFWRSGRSNIARYETSDLRVRVYEASAVVTGLLRRERNFNGQVVLDRWRFTKVYVKRGGAWRVVAYQASVAPP